MGKNKKTITALVALVVIVFAVGGWMFYHNQQTVPNSLVNQGYRTLDSRQSDDIVTNHLGISVALFFSKNSATLDGFQPVEKKSYLGDPKLIKSNTRTAKKIYKALTGNETYNAKDYLKPISVDLGRVHVTKNKDSWTLESKKLTLTFHKTNDGNWATADGTLWFPVKPK